MRLSGITAAAALVLGAGAAFGQYSIVQGNNAPTYGTTLNFDEPGTPTGVVPRTQWQASHGVIIDAGDGVPFVDNFSVQPGQSWLGTGNCFYGAWGVFMNFDADLTALSLQVWDPSGRPGPFGGGLRIFLFDNTVEVHSAAFTPAWGGVGDTWFDITAVGAVFDEVRVLGYGFFPTTHADNLSWDGVGCYPDCDTTTGVGVLDIFDFLCFQNRFAALDPYACDCDTATGQGVCDIFDFLCFQNEYAAGCP